MCPVLQGVVEACGLSLSRLSVAPLQCWGTATFLMTQVSKSMVCAVPGRSELPVTRETHCGFHSCSEGSVAWTISELPDLGL